MNGVQRWLSVVYLGGLLVTTVAPAVAQSVSSTIQGTVRDESGGALPGVVVEVSSPALIGGTTSLVTRPDGSYRVTDLRPGTYTLVFSLSGFQTLRHEGISLSSAFTATLDVNMKLGAVEESVTVSGKTPIVDTTTAVSQAVITEELKDAIPMGRSMGSIVGLAPGIVTAGTTGVDVAGSRALLNTSIQVHGSNSADTTWNFNGLDITSAIGPGNPAGYYNDGILEEAAVLTNALPAEIGGGGVFINFTPRSGANQFNGSVFANGTWSDLQGDNLSEEQIAQGLLAPTRIHKMYDFNPGFGGPIKRDRLWFYASARRQIVQLLLANQFNVDGSQVLDQNQNKNMSFSTLAQVTAGGRLAFVFDSAWKENLTSQTGVAQCVTFPRIVDISATSKQPTYPRLYSGKWTSVLNSNTTFEAGVSVMTANYNIEHGPFSGNEVPRIDIGRDFVTGGDACSSFVTNARRNGQFVFALTPEWHGTHNIRLGGKMEWMYYNIDGPSNGRGDWAWRYNNGVPNSVAIFNLPYKQEQSWNEMGYFIQDSWLVGNRLTLNYGARFEYIHGRIPQQEKPAGIWTPAATFPEIDDVPNWFTIVPRLALIYDLFGSGRTAIKANVSQYTERIGSGYMRAINPTSRGFSTVPWTDRNNDLIPQSDELGTPGPFSGGTNVRYADDVKRPYQLEYTVSLQHQLFESFGLTLSYFRRQYYDTIGTKNLLIPPDFYIPVTILDPLNGGPLTVYNQRPGTLDLRDQVRDNYSEIDNRYNGFEFLIDKRFSDQFMLLSGLTVGSQKGTINSGDLNNPNLLINNEGNIGNDATLNFKTVATYRLPRAFYIGANVQSRSGYPLQRNYTVTRTQVPTLTQVNQTIQLAPRGEYRRGQLTLVDVRFSKRIESGRFSFEPLFEVYNLLNNNSSITEVETVGPNLGFITETVMPRVAKFGFKMRF
jgi:hypothetical protein